MATAEPVDPIEAAANAEAEAEERRDRAWERYVTGLATREAWTREDFLTRRDELIKRR